MEERMKRFVILFVFAILVRTVFINDAPFFKDEALYAETIDVMIKSGDPAPYYLGEVARWKPPGMYWVYVLFVFPFHDIGVPVEVLYRLPGVLLGALCSLLVYEIVRVVSNKDDLGYIAGLAYAGNGLVIAVNLKLLTDSLLSLFILASVMCYILSRNNPRTALLGGLLAGLAVFTKTLVGLMAPLLAIAYFLLFHRKGLWRWETLTSFLFIPLVFMSIYLFMPGVGEQYQRDTSTRIVTDLGLGFYFSENILQILQFSMVWLMIGIYGVYRYRTELCNRFWYVWAVFGLFPLVVPGSLFWYLLPLVPVISFFAAKVIVADKRIDFLSLFFVFALTLLSIPGVYVYQNLIVSSGDNLESREIGEYLSEKDTLLVMQYNPTIIYYKVSENREYDDLSALFLINHETLTDEELESLIVDSMMPENTIDLHSAILRHFTYPRIHYGDFSKQRNYVALQKDIYEKRIVYNSDYSDFSLDYEGDFFVVLRRN